MASSLMIIDLESHPQRVSGRTWIGYGDAQAPWTFDLLIPRRVRHRGEVRWAELLPAEDVTRWLSLDLEREHMVISPGDACGESS